MVDLVAIEPIRHDGADIAPGAVFACPSDAADALLAAGAARAATADEVPTAAADDAAPAARRAGRKAG